MILEFNDFNMSFNKDNNKIPGFLCDEAWIDCLKLLYFSAFPWFPQIVFDETHDLFMAHHFHMHDLHLHLYERRSKSKAEQFHGSQ